MDCWRKSGICAWHAEGQRRDAVTIPIGKDMVNICILSAYEKSINLWIAGSYEFFIRPNRKMPLSLAETETL